MAMWGRIIPLAGVTDEKHLLNRWIDTCKLTHRSTNTTLAVALPEGHAPGKYRQKFCHHNITQKSVNVFLTPYKKN